ncbi:unnamed protein product [Polarella glacialis]|uniref:PARP catalytic domain-containing protein n=1 Tax=Polarella glacialis TaxID=89957 RepID=A0A813I522_POLGL|nr:unnamed protein product [Polarella glacialis]
MITGHRDHVHEAQGQLLEDLKVVEKASEPQDLKLGSDEDFESAVIDLRAFLMRRGMDDVGLEPQTDTSQLVIRAMGEMSLLRAMSEFRDWKDERAAIARSNEAEQGGVKYPGDASLSQSEWFKWDTVSPEEANMPGARFEIVEPDSLEYRQVVHNMREETGLGKKGSTFTKQIILVERVVNPVLWMKYWSRCNTIKLIGRNQGSANEMWVKHGTAARDPKVICDSEVGLSRNYSREYGNYFGQAVYTAENAWYVDRGYSFNCPDGKRQMLLCRVSAGTACDMEQNSESEKTKVAPNGYDSVRGEVNPGCFAIMVYQDEQVYPAYLVTYQPEDSLAT